MEQWLFNGFGDDKRRCAVQARTTCCAYKDNTSLFYPADIMDSRPLERVWAYNHGNNIITILWRSRIKAAGSLALSRTNFCENGRSRGERQYAEIVLTRRGRGVETATAPMPGTIRSASAKGRRRKPFCVSAHASRSAASFSLALYAYKRALISFTLISLRACSACFVIFFVSYLLYFTSTFHRQFLPFSSVPHFSFNLSKDLFFVQFLNYLCTNHLCMSF